MNTIPPRTQAFDQMAPETRGDLETKPRRRLSKGQIGLCAAALIAVVAGVYFGQDYYRVGRFLETTDDAYVKADFTIVAPKVSGYIAEVRVEDNQTVKSGAVAARIDDRDFRTALDQAKAGVA